MRRLFSLFVIPVLLTFWSLAGAATTCPAAGLEEIAVLDPGNGSIRELRQQPGGPSIAASGAGGLWELEYQDGTRQSASAFGADAAERRFSMAPGDAPGSATLTYRSAELNVVVQVRRIESGIECQAEVSPVGKTVVEFTLPGQLRFDPAALRRLVCPGDGNQTVGIGFRSTFFQPHPADRPASWKHASLGPQGYASLFGEGVPGVPDENARVALQVTDAGRQWLGSSAERIARAEALVNRPMSAKQADVVLVDSAHGPYLAASRLGGKGYLWRIGGGVDAQQESLSLEMIGAVARRIAQEPPAGRRRLGVIALAGGPQYGGWTSVSSGDWLERFERLAAVESGRVELVKLSTVRELNAALAADDFLAILNPYGEWLPVQNEGDLPAALRRIGRFVREGGHWFEVGGYSFYAELRPDRMYDAYEVTYPPAFADFLHLDTQAGLLAVYGVQPRTWQPWQGKDDPAALFVPGRIACGGDEQGGWCRRAFSPVIAAGGTWRSPPVRLIVGQAAPAALGGYARANALTKPLAEKVKPELLAKLRQAVLVYLGGNCREKLAALEHLPQPTLVHFADYLHGGFDKQYPDHLPPNPRFGTPEEFHALFDRARRLGHLISPYTNPTWWCDDPRGPTFEKAGEAPLLRTLDGKLSPERYSDNTGFTICHWHEAVQAANRRTVRQFTEEYPVDVLFQDQCGARRWRHDTNPASPTPHAYIEGLLSQVAEDAARVPLGTESGWDQVARYETQLCGMTWQIVPTEGGPAWRRLMKETIAPDRWEVFPVAQYLAHDSVIMLHHDLGQFVTNQQVLSWTLGLGYSLSYRAQATAVERTVSREWLRWLDRLQKSVVARYIGLPLEEFAHDRGAAPSMDDDGVIRTRYGDLRLIANLGPVPRPLRSVTLAPYGFLAIAPDMVAGHISAAGGRDFGSAGLSFVAQTGPAGTDVWCYARAEQEAVALLPAVLEGEMELAFDGGQRVSGRAAGRVLQFTLPPAEGERRTAPPAELAGRAPRDWPGAKPAIGVLDFGPTVAPVWVQVGPGQWVEALKASGLVQRQGLSVERIADFAQLGDALAAGPTRYLAIVNPYGERFPAAGSGQWRASLDRIRDYVNRGGSWWETGGYSFHQAFWTTPEGCQTENVGADGLRHLGLPIVSGELDQPPEPLRVPDAAKPWLGEELAARVAKAESAVNRSMPAGWEDPGHFTLVAGRRQDFVGGYRLDGWGWLWRVGGMNPDAEIIPAVAAAAIEHVYTHPPQPRVVGGVRYLWHAVAAPK